MVSYESKEKILFSADAFGTFGALNGALFDDEIFFDAIWMRMQEDIIRILSGNMALRCRRF
mgnify:CR=1 FL=1